MPLRQRRNGGRSQNKEQLRTRLDLFIQQVEKEGRDRVQLVSGARTGRGSHAP